MRARAMRLEAAGLLGRLHGKRRGSCYQGPDGHWYTLDVHGGGCRGVSCGELLPDGPGQLTRWPEPVDEWMLCFLFTSILNVSPPRRLNKEQRRVLARAEELGAMGFK